MLARAGRSLIAVPVDGQLGTQPFLADFRLAPVAMTLGSVVEVWCRLTEVPAEPDSGAGGVVVMGDMYIVSELVD